MTGRGAVFVAIGLAVVGFCLGGGLGAAAGAAYVELADVTWREGTASMVIILEFVPVGAVLGAFGLPVGYFALR